MSSWPALFAAAVAMWLILKGPVVKKTILGSKNLPPRDGVFPLLAFLYLLKWNPFWRWMSSVDFEEPKQAKVF